MRQLKTEQWKHEKHVISLFDTDIHYLIPTSYNL